VGELWSHGFAKFLAERPLEAGLLSGVLLTLLVSFFVERVLAVTRRAKWESVSTAAFEALAREVGVVIAGLNELVAGDDDANALGHAAYQARLRQRLDGMEWSLAARKELEELRVVYRNSLALWAGALVATGELADVLKRVASLNTDLSALEEWLRIRCGRGGFTSLGWTQDELVEIWDTVLAEAISLREDLWREAKGTTDPAWRSFRSPASPGRAELMADREDRSVRRVHERLVNAPKHPATLAGV
jgi:hypothetical protein